MLYTLIILFGVIPLSCAGAYLTYKTSQFFHGFMMLFFYYVMEKGIGYALVWLIPYWSVPDVISHMMMARHGESKETGRRWVFIWPSTFRKFKEVEEDDEQY